MNTTIEATYTVATPMFCAGAVRDQAEVRVPSFKGMLRFWWRALAWSKYGGDLSTIMKQEDKLFGSTENGQSSVLMRLLTDPPTKFGRTGDQLIDDAGKVVGAGARYLGYGLVYTFPSRKNQVKEGQLIRACILPGYTFTMSLRYRKPIDDELTELLCDALKAIGMLGGMGARARRGYGSLVLQSLKIENETVWTAPQTFDDLAGAISELLGRYRFSGLPDYTALSNQTRCVILELRNATALVALDRIGREMLRYRSSGKDGRILENKPAEGSFRQDHDLMKSNRPKTTYPLRVAFGLPQNYYFSSTEERFAVSPADNGLDRRASPLMIHIHNFSHDRMHHAIVVSFLPAKFLPGLGPGGKRSSVRISGKTYKGPPTIELPEEDKLYEPIHRFLDRLNGPARCKESFLTSREVIA